MKNLLLILAILMLGCGTDTEVVEEPPPIAEEPEPDTRVFVVYEIGPTVPADRGDPDPPQIIKSNVYPNHERFAFNPARLNEEGIFFDFNEDLHRFVIDLSLDGESLDWLTSVIRPDNNIGLSITLIPPVNGPFLERGKEYLIDLVVGDKTGDVLELEIPLRTIH
jgi:hypothetical protein